MEGLQIPNNKECGRGKMDDQLYITNENIVTEFGKKYPGFQVIGYRPLCPELYTKDRIGVTIWLVNGDIIQYYPHEITK